MKFGAISLRVVVGAVFVFLLMPLVTVIVTSLSTSPVMVFPPQGFTLHWYTQIPSEFYRAAWTSLVAATATALLSALVGTPAALALVRGNLPGRLVISAACMSPLAVPTLILAVGAFQFTSYIFKLTGVALDDSIPGLVLAQSAFGIPFVIRAVVANEANFDRSLEEASANLGAPPLVTFLRVTLPLLAPGIASGAVFAFLMSFDDVPIALFLTGGQLTTLPVKIFTSIEFSLDVWIMAVASIVIMMSLLLMVVIDRTIGSDRFFGANRS